MSPISRSPNGSIARALQGPGQDDFLTTGAEAIENAVKIARAATKRSGVIAFSGAFHGRTFMTIAMTGKVVPYKKSFGPFPGEIYHVPYPQPFPRRRVGGFPQRH